MGKPLTVLGILVMFMLASCAGFDIPKDPTNYNIDGGAYSGSSGQSSTASDSGDDDGGEVNGPGEPCDPGNGYHGHGYGDKNHGHNGPPGHGGNRPGNGHGDGNHDHTGPPGRR